MKRLVALVLVLAFMHPVLLFGKVGATKTLYVGGTVEQLKELTEGVSSAKDKHAFIFEYPGGRFLIPYERINSLEYGQKAGRRLGVAIAITWMALFSKKRKHFLTIGFLDGEGNQQAAVFELGKNTVRVTLASLEARTGQKIDYEDDEARKSGRGN